MAARADGLSERPVRRPLRREGQCQFVSTRRLNSSIKFQLFFPPSSALFDVKSTFKHLAVMTSFLRGFSPPSAWIAFPAGRIESTLKQLTGVSHWFQPSVAVAFSELLQPSQGKGQVWPPPVEGDTKPSSQDIKWGRCILMASPCISPLAVLMGHN